MPRKYVPVEPRTVACVVCGREFETKRKDARACSGKCRARLWKQTHLIGSTPRRGPKPTPCIVCDKPLASQQGKFCSAYCAGEYAKTQRRYLVPHAAECSTGSLGAATELLVCADLLFKGYEVFRAVSPACGCDLVAAKGGKLIRVEVKMGRRKKDGRLSCNMRNGQKPKHHALAVVVLEESAIVYEPALN